MNLKNAKGSSAIPLTPFLENGDIDVKTLEKYTVLVYNSITKGEWYKWKKQWPSL